MNNNLNEYLAENNIAKLQLGCGRFPLPGWFNTDANDYLCSCGKAFYLDVKKHFDIPDCSFDYVFSEHLFEHLSYNEGLNMINECYRVLKQNGIMRISTPNLEFLIDLYINPEKEINNEYIKFDAKRNKLPENPVYAINNFHTNWGHKIIYDPKSLTELLKTTGFSEVYQCKLGKSKYECLNNIEMHGDHFKMQGANFDFNILQSMVFEAKK